MTLFVRDFDHERDQEAQEARRLLRARHTDEELAAAVAQARAEGRAEGQALGESAGWAAAQDSFAARQAQALDELSPRLETILQDAAAHRQALEAQSLDFALSVCEQVFPEILRGYSHTRAADRVRRSLRMALGSSTLRIHLSPEALTVLAPRIRAAAANRPDSARMELIADPQLADGDVRAEWDNGFMEYSFAAICDQLLTALRRSQFHPTQPLVKESDRHGR